MAPIKFEEQIKDTLEKRALQPSVKAWDRLEAQLQKEDKKRNKSTFWWFGIAASIIGIIVIVNQMRQTNYPNDINAPVFVETETEEETKPIQYHTSPTEMTTINDETVLETLVAQTPKDRQEKKESRIENKAIQKDGIKKRNVNLVQAIAKTETTKQTFKDPITTDVNPNIKEIPKDALVLDTESVLNKKKVSDSEIETLLQEAKNQMTGKENSLQKTKTVDANSLLDDVETEMKFPESGRLFKLIEKNYKTVKTAVATRNN